MNSLNNFEIYISIMGDFSCSGGCRFEENASKEAARGRRFSDFSDSHFFGA